MIAALLADRGSNPDLRSAKVGPRPTIGPSHFFGQELSVYLMYVERANPHRIAVKTFFLYFVYGLQSHFRFFECDEDPFFGLRLKFHMQFFLGGSSIGF